MGSWFCNSLTKRVRKSLDVISDELVELVDELVALPVTLDADAVLAEAVDCGDNEEATLVDADEPTPIIELFCDISILFHSFHFCRFCQKTTDQTLKFNQVPLFGYIPNGKTPSLATPFRELYVSCSSRSVLTPAALVPSSPASFGL